MGWASMRDRMLRTAVAALNDGAAFYQDPTGTTVAQAVEVMIDHNLQQNGPDGLSFLSELVGITWRKAQLASVGRGGIFAHSGARYLVEEIIADDGHMVTAACMVAP